ncbi:helicase RepA family protein [Pseudomonas sp. PP3]|uniref:helicase RepA family protein n=1 Tax=Pseudomonas sp. PP3 TaxID=2815936 RepID=UPI001BAE7A1F|nr:helicase RepA family protein [Pseudomonas sp. PP3]
MPMNLKAAFENAPPELDFIWPGFLAGTVGAIVAPGATGKTFWALQAAMAVACSVPGGDLLNISPTRSGHVVYIAAEDPVSALHPRIYSIGQKLTPSARLAITKSMTLKVITGNRWNIMVQEELDSLVSECTGCRLIVLDTLSRIHRLDENSNGEMAYLISTLEYVADQTGASVLYLHHVSKGSAREGQTDQQHAARGASALIDNVRWCGYLAKMGEDETKKIRFLNQDTASFSDQRGSFVRFGVSKQNYDITPRNRWYNRSHGGVLVPVDVQELSTGVKKKGRRDEV